MARPINTLAQLSGSLQQLASKVSPAVVQIEVSGFGLSQDADRKQTALIVRHHAVGAGVIVDSDGYIMTNAHVVQGAQRIRVVLSVAPPSFGDVPSSGKVQVLNAKVVGLQKDTDLALLKVQARNLPTLHFRLDKPAQPGELVFAVGSPEGLQNSVTMGVISSAWRQLDPDNPMFYLQTDAPINPGNSGGPLVDVSGAVVGLNTLILSNGGGSEGLGFAIPARVVDFVYKSLRKYGHVYRTEIGVVPQTITPTMADGLGLAQNWGVLIADVIPHGPADAAGIRPGDVILALDGYAVPGLSGFATALYLHPPDEVLTADVLRGTEKLSIEISAMRARDRIDQLADLADPVSNRIEPLGIFALNLDRKILPLLPDLRILEGVVVIGQAPGFNSVDTGLQPGDVIHALNRTPIESVEQLQSLVAQLKPGAAAVLRIERQGQFQYLAFEM
ncbi:MAG TPA: trypsin-like peptidase domain-containing protein, partial [Terriglobales bacterium]|nr:trypsin-like peptidase domain-containing protein [Terriglobales bacterium]